MFTKILPFFYSAKVAMNYTGWWYTYPSEKYDFVSWDDEIRNRMEE